LSSSFSDDKTPWTALAVALRSGYDKAMDCIRQARSPGNRLRPHAAFTLIEILVIAVIIAFVLILVFSTLPRRKQMARRLQCANNLKQIGLAFKLWPGDDNKYQMQKPVKYGGTQDLIPTGQASPHFRVMSNELASPKLLFCPSDTTRSGAANFLSLTDSNISYWVNVDLDEGFPDCWMSGDRNLSTNGSPIPHGLVILKTNTVVGWQNNLHVLKGNVLLCDGSVQQPSATILPGLLSRSGMETNRLAVP
jgi:prepilin-type processing-associated H-X9-DG protein